MEKWFLRTKLRIFFRTFAGKLEKNDDENSKITPDDGSDSHDSLGADRQDV